MELRKKNITCIKYILVTDKRDFTPFLVPEEFDNYAIEFIKQCPIDLIQLSEPIRFFEMYNLRMLSYGAYFQIFYTQNIDYLLDEITWSEHLNFIFLDSDSPAHIEAFHKIKGGNSLTYFNFRNDRKNEFTGPRVCSAPMFFISRLIEDQRQIFSKLKLSLHLNLSVDLAYKNFNYLSHFNPTAANYHILNQIIGNFCGVNLHPEEANFEQETIKAQASANSFNRQNKFLEQIKRSDFFKNAMLAQGLIKLPTQIEPRYSPLVLVVPFNNPDLRKLDKNLADLIQSEQTKNYIVLPGPKHLLQKALAGSRFAVKRMRFLDDAAYLHACFTFSSIIRVPIQGVSIYRELSFFRTLSFKTLSVPANRKKLNKSILKFGSILAVRILSPEMQELIQRRNSQVIAISDLPIEWTCINGVPLSFTHDVCRMPETPFHGLMSFYAANNTVEYFIPKNILSKTLVILGSQDSPFLFWHNRVHESAALHNFRVEKCTALAQLKSAIEKHKPDLLIFDCHGGVDEDTKSTFLWIGNEKLTGQYAIEHGIYAPIVFISACGTAPTYSAYNSIANAFFKAGALAATTTFIPIGIDSGSFLYLRILEKLAFITDNVIHKNWLEFICHVIRTSTMSDTYLKLLKNYTFTQEEFIKSQTQAVQNSLFFSRRRNLYGELDRHIQSLTRDKKMHYSETVPEYLLYSTLGRADLIIFENWREKFIELNSPEP